MPVPSSYNDITEDGRIRDFIGWAWYDTEFFLSSDWTNKRVVLRIDSAQYNAIVWVNSKQVMTHQGGHIPFQADINQYLTVPSDGPNRLTVAVNNTLTPYTIPPGTIDWPGKDSPIPYPPNYFTQTLQMDSFNYAGIDRHVSLYTTPKSYIDDITVTTNIVDTTGIVNYRVVTVGDIPQGDITVRILNRTGAIVGQGGGSSGTIKIPNANLWWTVNTNNLHQPGYLYTLEVHTGEDVDADVYRLPFGIRTVKVVGRKLLLNNEEFYFKGVGIHNEAEIRGRGLDYAMIVKDFNLMRWVGANSFRTAVFPFSEEWMDQADQQGFLVVDEVPAVGLNSLDNLSNQTLQNHMNAMSELIQRDKNRPSVFLWSVANEPRTDRPESLPYFQTIINFTRSLDPNRLVSFMCNHDFNSDKCVHLVDLIFINRYVGWYSQTGLLDLIQPQLKYDLDQWAETFNKPLVISKYGAGTMPEIHRVPSTVFSEEYQIDFLSRYHRTFDSARGNLTGEFVWCLTDFNTYQSIKRVNGNKKGIFTRERQPKMSAFNLRHRYLTFNNTDYCTKNPYT
ncbi:beta-glucuronidase-like [Patella vulgata]|uniref:beta-glucuronidase-like n=1 Tax=Patella vulgata TaxID=6465 RepID=UPI0024A7C7A7|nr:beta-glucuronidase-like [Patella vulgata]